MSLENFLIMRQELLLTVAALLILMAEIFAGSENRKPMSSFSALLFGVITIAGFLPSPGGNLFGGCMKHQYNC